MDNWTSAYQYHIETSPSLSIPIAHILLGLGIYLLIGVIIAGLFIRWDGKRDIQDRVGRYWDDYIGWICSCVFLWAVLSIYFPFHWADLLIRFIAHRPDLKDR